MHGLRWYQFDLSGLVIRFLAWTHLARNVFIVPKAQWKRLLEDRRAAARARVVR